jgi:UTP-glucose-1-phosphate uridylyltransferase
MIQRVRKAVFPVAGLGTRLLPATKVMPKEMLTVVDRPLIQYAVDEAREAGIEQMIFVTGRGKSSLVDYFDQAFELETTLREKGTIDYRRGVLTIRNRKKLGKFACECFETISRAARESR